MPMLFIIFLAAIAVAFFVSRIKKPRERLPLPSLPIAPEASSMEPVTTLADLGYEEAATSPPSATPPKQPLKASSPCDLFMIYLTAPTDHPFQGYELVQALIAADLRFGERDLFHRFDSEGNILFSIAQATESGAFELDKLGGIVCRGLVLFMQPDAETAEFVLEQLLDTAYQLAEDLDGRLEDARRQPLTEEFVENYRGQCVVAADTV